MTNNFKKDLLSGVIYTGIGKYTSLLISLLVTAILARLLSPNDFGIIAIATVIMTFFNMISEIGIAPAIIQYKDLSSNDISIIFSLTVYIGLSSSIVFYLISPYIAAFYENEVLVDILRFLSINLLFVTINVVPNALFYKEKKFKLISIRTFIIQLIVGTIGVIAAICGLGIYSLLVAPILSSIILFVVSYIYYPQKFSLIIKLEPVKKIFKYSSFQFLYNIINYFTRNLDKLLIGKYIGMVSLGYYEKSYRLMMLPLSNINNVITPVLHPIFSDFQSRKDEMEIKYSKIIKVLCYIGIYLTILLFWAGEEIILIAFGEQWLEAVDVFQILSLTIIIQMIMSPCGSIFQATNSTKEMFEFGVISIFTTILGFIITIIFWESVIAIAYSFNISLIINFLIGYYIIYHKIFKKSYLTFLFSLRHIFILFCISYIIVSFISQLVVIENIILSFIVKAIIVLILEVLYLKIFKVFNFRFNKLMQ